MASGKSSFLSKKLLDHVLGITTYTGPVTVYAALWTATIDGTSTAATVGEASYTGYARVAITNNTTNFPAATGSSNGSKASGTAITFASNGGSVQTVTFFALVDSASGAGNILWWGSVASTAINPGDTPQVAAGSLTVTEA